jgi:hypothetical protein
MKTTRNRANSRGRNAPQLIERACNIYSRRAGRLVEWKTELRMSRDGAEHALTDMGDLWVIRSIETVELETRLRIAEASLRARNRACSVGI